MTALVLQAPRIPPEPLILARALLLSAAAAVALCLLLDRICSTPRGAPSAVALGALTLGLYPSARQLLIGPESGDARLFGVGYLAVCALITLAILRSPRTFAASLYQSVRVLALVLGLLMLHPIYFYYRPNPPVPASQAAALAELPTLAVGDAPARRPDVYHIILDGLGRSDVLQAMYGLDISGTVRELSDLGFEVSANGSANYTQTYLSVASLMSASYLEPLGKHMPESLSRIPLEDLIQRRSVLETFKRFGYEVVFIGSNYPATLSHRLADTCECYPPLIGEFESIITHLTPFGDSGLGGVDYRPHRGKLQRSFAALESLTAAEEPRIVLAHLIAPHPPFVLDDRGRGVNPSRAYSLFDGNLFRGSQAEYRFGYGQQARYILERVGRIVRRFQELSRDAGRDAVIIIHGDHGPRARFHATDPTRTDAAEVVPVFLAIRWAASREEAGGSVNSLVNIYREFFRRYFNAPIELLPDRAFISSFSRPYQFLEVDPTVIRVADEPAGRE